MAMDSGSVDVVLDFLRRNKFSRAEAALRSELVSRTDFIGIFDKLSLDDKGLSNVVEGRKQDAIASENQGIDAESANELSEERITKEFELEYESWRKNSINGEENMSTVWCKTIDPADASSDFAQDQISEVCIINSDTKKLDSINAPVDPFSSNDSLISSGLPGIQTAGQSQTEPYSQREKVKAEEAFRVSSQNGSSWAETFRLARGSSRVAEDSTDERNQARSCNEEYVHVKLSSKIIAGLAERESSGSSRDEQTRIPETRKDFPGRLQPDTDKENALTIGNTTDGKRTTDSALSVLTIIENDDGCGGPLRFNKEQIFSELQDCTTRGLSFMSENQIEEFPQLRPVRLISEEKGSNWEKIFEPDIPSLEISDADSNFHLKSFLDIPIGQDMKTSGGKNNAGGSWLSVSRGISEDTNDFVSGFATVGNGFAEMIIYPNEFWDSDEYEDDDDVGYIRQPIEDETWFLAHEIDCPSDNEKLTGHGTVPDSQQRSPAKEEDRSFAEEDSYFSGEHFFEDKIVEPVDASEDPLGISADNIFGTVEDVDMVAQYDGQLMDEEEITLMRAEPVWQGFVTQTSGIMFDDKFVNKNRSLELEDVGIYGDQHSSIRSIGVCINSDTADFGCEVSESLAARSNEGDSENTHDHDVSVAGSTSSYIYSEKILLDGTYTGRLTTDQLNYDKYVIGNDKGSKAQMKSQSDCVFSFPSPSRDRQALQLKTSDENWYNSVRNGFNDSSNDGMNISRSKDGRRSRSSDSSSDGSYIDENVCSMERLGSSPCSNFSNFGSLETNFLKIFDDMTDARGEVHVSSIEDEEALAVQEQVRKIQAQEDEFETFNLKIIHRKNRTGFEEDKSFQVVLNSVIAGRYHVTEYLGSAAFSKAIQAHDLHTGLDVCVKIIKNNKDFFDQSLDEIKLLKYVNKNDPADKYHILRLYDYFYFHEHLLIVSELLKANLYEFQKFNKESGGEVYFTMPRLQSVAIQCLEALQFLHGLGIIHCDLKPENVLVKSYSRCEVKVIDLGSSCFETDHLCSYVQSRSYRAPEVILGLPYDQKIDIWSLGCILAELCTGNVLFQNDSPATLLARVIGIIGPIEQEMFAKGKDTSKYFTKNHMLYERNQETSRLEYLIPKKSSLQHRLPMGDQSFTEFVAHLLEINPNKRPSATQALNHPWLSHPYEPISS